MIVDTLPFTDDEARQRHYLRLRARGCPHEKAVEIAGGRYGGHPIGVVDDRFCSQSNDGFSDDFSRRLCKANAAAAGIETAGKVYVPGLASKGKGVGRDPRAWTDGSRSEVKKFCEQNHCNAEGAVNFSGPPAPPEERPKRYEVCDELAHQHVETQCAQEDRKPDKKTRKKLFEDAKNRLSGA